MSGLPARVIDEEPPAVILESEPTERHSEDAPRAALVRMSSQRAWRRSAPGALVDAVTKDDLKALARELRSRPLFARSRRSGNAEPDCPLVLQPLWSRYAFEESPRSVALADVLLKCDPRSHHKRKHGVRTDDALADLFEEFRFGPAPDPFELLGWLGLLLGRPDLRDELFAEIWLKAWEWARPYWNATGWQNGAPLTDDQRVLTTAELPWLCSLLFRDMKGSRRVRQRGTETLRAELLAGCDTHGVPHAYLLERLPLWLAPFVRSAGVAKMAGKPWRDKAARNRLEHVVRRVAALTRSTGEVALSNGAAFAQASLLKTAVAGAGLKRSAGPARFASQLPADFRNVANRQSRTARPLPLPGKRKHRPSAQSDAARIACLRSNWDAGADACVIAFDGETPRIDLTAFGVPLLQGTWDPGGSLDGEPLRHRSEWECVCWFSDADTDYLELKQTAAGDVELLRQVLLSRNDHFLFLCDIVKTTTSTAAEIEQRLQLPLVRGADYEQDALTREWRVRCGPLRVRAIPLGLPQESLLRASGSLVVTSDGIMLKQHAHGTGLACPLILDWSPNRRKAATQWRQLTIAEGGVTLSGSDACAVRWRIGDAQWLYYHALTPRYTARTVLGLHTFNETVLGELAGGELQQLVQVEEGGPE